MRTEDARTEEASPATETGGSSDTGVPGDEDQLDSLVAGLAQGAAAGQSCSW